MKYLLSFALVIVSIVGVFAQKEMNSKEILTAIDKKQAVQYDGVTIVGDLDLTELSNRKIKKQSLGWEEIKTIVEVPVVFRNCTFKGDVIAYKHLKDGKPTRIFDLGDGGTTYSTDFRESVVFENCNFGGNSEFKYSTFSKNVNFSGSKFQNQANFKYAVFKNDAYFSGIRFEEYANFKYADFSDKAEFQDTSFGEYADFKYTEFTQKANFSKGRFQRHADFKYTEFNDGVVFEKTNFEGSTDFKYSNGKRYIAR